jgi:nucleoside-diphosphate-sugar epimerase
MNDQVLVTGINGFIAKQVAVNLLKAGYSVRGTIRKKEIETTVRESIARAGGDLSRLTCVVADLTRSSDWDAAADSCRFVQHIASPVPLESPALREALVPIARDGTLRVLAAAHGAGVERIVLTSSLDTMVYRTKRLKKFTVREGDWTDPDLPVLSAYTVSKVRAERAAWDFVETLKKKNMLTVINPGMVMGPALDRNISASLVMLELILKRAYPALPSTAYPIVDVRDLSELHVRAMTNPEVGGRRLLAASDTLSMREIAEVLRAELGRHGRRIPHLNLPSCVVKIMARFDPTIRTLLADLDLHPIADSAYVTALTGVAFRPGREAVVAAGKSLIEQGLITAD